MVKTLVFGAGGLVGYRLSNLIMGTGLDYFGTYNMRNPLFPSDKVARLDIRKFDEVEHLIAKVDPDVIINCCSITSVDYCETHEDEAMKLNVDFVSRLYNYSSKRGIKLVHISSDSVFDGKKDSPYTEVDIPNPINVYGRTKLASEKIIMQNPNNIIVRASVLYGWLPKFIAQAESSSMKSNNFSQWLIEQLKKLKQVTIITDEISTPIIADDVARAILHLVINKQHGLFNLAPPLVTNRYDFSVQIAKKLSLSEKLISATTNKELGRVVRTGQNKSLNSEKVVRQTGFKFLALEESLELLRSQVDV